MISSLVFAALVWCPPVQAGHNAPAQISGLPRNAYVTCIAQVGHHAFVGTRSDGLWRLTEDSDVAYAIGGLDRCCIECIAQINATEALVGTRNRGLWRVNESRRVATQIAAVSRTATIFTITPDETATRAIISLKGAGIRALDLKTNTSEKISGIPDDLKMDPLPLDTNKVLNGGGRTLIACGGIWSIPDNSPTATQIASGKAINYRCLAPTERATVIGGRGGVWSLNDDSSNLSKLVDLPMDEVQIMSRPLARGAYFGILSTAKGDTFCLSGRSLSKLADTGPTDANLTALSESHPETFIIDLTGGLCQLEGKSERRVWVNGEATLMRRAGVRLCLLLGGRLLVGTQANGLWIVRSPAQSN